MIKCDWNWSPSLRANRMGTDANALILKWGIRYKENEMIPQDTAQLCLSFVSNKHPSKSLSPSLFSSEKLKGMQVYKRTTSLVYKDHEEKLCIWVEPRLNHVGPERRMEHNYFTFLSGIHLCLSYTCHSFVSSYTWPFIPHGKLENSVNV